MRYLKIVCIILKYREVDSKLIRAVQSIYQNIVNYVVINNGRSDTFVTRERLRQVKGFITTFFMVFMDEIIRNVNKYDK